MKMGEWDLRICWCTNSACKNREPVLVRTFKLGLNLIPY